MDLHSVQELVDARSARWQPGDAFLGGGTWLFSEPQLGLRRLLDLHSFGWPSLVADDSGLEIAATCTLAELARASLPEAWPARVLLRQCCDALLGSFKVWNMATVGGNICLGLPAGPMTSLTASLDGVCTIWSPDGTVSQRPVTDVVVGPGRTTLSEGQLLRSVRLPSAALRSRTAFRQVSLAPVGRSAALVIGRVSALAGEVVLTVTAATTRPVQLRYSDLPSYAEVVADIDAAARYHDDVHGSPQWRRAMTHRLLGEVVAELAA